MNDIPSVFYLGQASAQGLLNYQLSPAGDPSQERAQRFGHTIRDAILSNNHNALSHCLSLGEDAPLSCPTPEHYLPLLYIMALQVEGETMSSP